MSPTAATRRYCMTATSRMSAPNASAIRTMAVAAPGEEPQIAVVPGSAFQRARRTPSTAAIAITAPIPIRKIGHCLSIVAIEAAPMALAMRQPITPCARMNDRGGICTRPSNDASRIAPAIAPNSSAAGSPASRKRATQASVAPMSAAQCRTAGRALSFSGRIFMRARTRWRRSRLCARSGERRAASRDRGIQGRCWSSHP